MPLDNADEYANHIPAGVRRAAARAEELARAAAAPVEEETSEAPETPVEAPVEPPQLEAPPAPPQPPPVDWEQRYRTLQGKYDAEIPQVRQLQTEVMQLRQLLANLQSAPQPAAPPSTTTTTVVVPPEDASEFGEDLIAAARRWARAELQNDVDALRAQLAELQGGHQTIQAQTTQQRVMAVLNADPMLAGGRWQQLNNDPEFLTWLNQVDTFSGQLRLDLLREAAGRGDADRCAQFFKAFITEHTVTQPSTPAVAQTPPPEVAGARTSLEELAAPGRASGQAPASGAPAEKRVWTRAEISRFYNDVRKGRYAGRDADMRRIEQDIIAASIEGRVHN